MKANKWTKFAVIPFAILLAACGSLPVNTTDTAQPEVRSQSVADAPQSPSAVECPPKREQARGSLSGFVRRAGFDLSHCRYQSSGLL